MLVLSTPLFGVAGPGTWTGQGPFGGQTRGLTTDPVVPSRLYLITANGFYRSVDGGASWQGANTGLLSRQLYYAQFTIDPNLSGGLWLSDDSGRIYHSSNAGTDWTQTGTTPGGQYASALRAVSGTPGMLYVSMHGEGSVSGGVYRSMDGGASFILLPGSPASVGSIDIDPTDPQHLLAGAITLCQPGEPASPMYRSVDAGLTWNAVTLGAGCQASYQLAVAFGPAGSERVYAIAQYSNLSAHDLYRSNDGGTSWTGTGLYAASIAVSPLSADVLWLGSSSGMYKSNDGGLTENPYRNGLTTNGATVTPVTAIAVHGNYPATPRLWVATSDTGVFISNNEGASWGESNDGLAATNIRALAVHPSDRTRLYAGAADANVSMGIYRSTTSGGWVASNSGLNADHVRSITIDPTTASNIGESLIYATGIGYDWSGGEPVDYNSGLYRSTDGGLTWATLDGGFPAGVPGFYRSLVLDPGSCATPPPSGSCTTGPLRTLYATGSGFNLAGTRTWRVIKSTDAGANWVNIDSSLPGRITKPDGSIHTLFGAVPLVIDPSHPSTLYIGTYAVAYDADGQSIPPDISSGVFKSVDGGASWVNKSTGLPRYSESSESALDVLSLAINPLDPQVLWASTMDFVTWDTPGLIYKSVDGGEHWSLSNAGITAPDTRALLVDPTDPSIVYAAGGGFDDANPGGVYKSRDAGASWQSISVGLPASSATALALDPVDPRVLHAGTTSGVYTITQLPDTDGDGVPDLIENSGPNGGDADGDGISDSQQAAVSTTALGLLGRSAWETGHGEDVAQVQARLQQLLDSGTVGGYFTVKLVDGDCSQSVDVAPVDAGPYGLDRVPHHGTYDYPRGLLRFELPQCSEATVDVIFNGAQFGNGWSWRFHGPSTPGDTATMGWHDANSLVTSRTANTWRILLRAGEFGSYRPGVAQSILFVGGPGQNDVVFNDGFGD